MITTAGNVIEIDRRKANRADRLRVPTDYSAQRPVMEAMLNEVLATELACVLRYRRYYFVRKPSHVDGVKPAFLHCAQVVGEDLLFVRTAMENYEVMVRYFERLDLTTARILASILAIHRQHAEELTALLIGLTPPLHG
jgi:bacterioferritin (cytochrome b1)